MSDGRPRRRFDVGDAAAGQRVDQFLAAALGPARSVHAARRLIAAGAVTVNGRSPKKGQRLAAGQHVDVVAAAAATGGAAGAVVADAGVPVELLFVDDGLVAINKPAGISSHPLQAGELGTAANGLVARFPECASASVDPREGGLGHRLDRETSGVLLAARSRAVWERLRASVGGAGCQKTYLAEVCGAPPDAGSFDGAIGRRGRRGGGVIVDGGRHPMPAHTSWVVLQRRDGSALVRARLHAGRAHQVRAHLAAVGHPIIGDAVYGDEAARRLSEERGIRTLRLHAESVRLRHPVTGAPFFVVAPPPAWAKIAG